MPVTTTSQLQPTGLPKVTSVLHRAVGRATQRTLDLVQTGITLVRLRVRGVRVGSGFRAYGRIDLDISPSATVVIGQNVRMKSGFRNPVGASQRLSLVATRGARLSIGDAVGMSNCCIFAAESIIIEAQATIGGGVAIYDTDFHSLMPEKRLNLPDRGVRTSPVVIGARSFIGAHSLILKGVHVGEGAVVGAGSVLRKSVPPYQIWAGNPAVFIRPVPGHESAALCAEEGVA